MNYLILKINMIGSSLIRVVDNILESGLEGKAAIDPDAVGE